MSSLPPHDEPRTSHDFLGEFAFADNERQDVTRRGERIPVSPWVRQLVFRRDGWRCQICGSSPFASATRRRSGPLHLDHIAPWSAGGSDRTDNLRTLGKEKLTVWQQAHQTSIASATSARVNRP